MSLQPVDLYVADGHDDPVEGVVVRVYNDDATALITQGTSDVDGHIGLLLESADSPFQLRFFKSMYSFANPLHITVSEVDPNTFDIPCLGLDAPVPVDSRLCTAYGHFKDPTGAYMHGVRFEFVPEFNPTILEGVGILPERIVVSTNGAGFAQVNLVRNAKYTVFVRGRSDYQQLVAVPDHPNVRLPDLIFPLVDSITFTPAIPASMSVGDEVVVTAAILRTDRNAGAPSEVQWSSSNANVLAVLPSGTGTVTLRALSAGTAEVRASRSDNSVVRIPDPGISGVPVSVVVS